MTAKIGELTMAEKQNQTGTSSQSGWQSSKSPTAAPPPPPPAQTRPGVAALGQLLASGGAGPAAANWAAQIAQQEVRAGSAFGQAAANWAAQIAAGPPPPRHLTVAVESALQIETNRIVLPTIMEMNERQQKEVAEKAAAEKQQAEQAKKSG